MRVLRKPSRRLVTALALSLFAALSLYSTAIASAQTLPVWSSGGKSLAFGTEVNFVGESNGGMDLRWEADGIPYWIECSSLSASGTVEDYSSGRAGSASKLSGAFKGCVLVEAGTYVFGQEGGTTCQLPSEIPVEFVPTKLSNATYLSGGLPLEFRNTETWIKNCAAGTRVLLIGNVEGREGQGQALGEIEVPRALNVRVAAFKAEIEFSMKFRTAAGAAISIAEEDVTPPSTPGHRYWYTEGDARKGEGPARLVSPGAPLTFSGVTSSLTIESNIGGLAAQISCNGSGTSSGSVENPVGGANGTASASLKFVGCKVVQPASQNCSIPNGEINLGPISGQIASSGEQLLNLTATELGVIQLTGCSTPGLNHKYPLKGSLAFSTGANSNAYWSLPKGSNSSGLTLYGQKATVAGLLTAEHGGKAVASY